MVGEMLQFPIWSMQSARTLKLSVLHNHSKSAVSPQSLLQNASQCREKSGCLPATIRRWRSSGLSFLPAVAEVLKTKVRWSERGNLNRVIQSNKIPREFRYKSKTRCSGSSEHAWMKTVLHIGMTVLLLTTLDLIIKKKVTAASRRNGLSYIVDGWRAFGDLRPWLPSMLLQIFRGTTYNRTVLSVEKRKRTSLRGVETCGIFNLRASRRYMVLERLTSQFLAAFRASRPGPEKSGCLPATIRRWRSSGLSFLPAVAEVLKTKDENCIAHLGEGPLPDYVGAHDKERGTGSQQTQRPLLHCGWLACIWRSKTWVVVYERMKFNHPETTVMAVISTWSWEDIALVIARMIQALAIKLQVHWAVRCGST
ncbi:hypothetical protein FHG87_005876 [Trinorchestia longiramus]|nr:hypothetical protein FHG87_005876 [Trinorchestia longiramus]